MIKIIAKTGLKVPRESAPHQHYSDAEPEMVANTVYVRRRISDGDLIIVADKPKTVKKEPTNG